ncbi:DUF7511 domain-containing protein [Haloprofundus halobius]|uniref:DUF7511 domain-containing protein n=1 Tax=Haloprofundus halobius TaxID=2876194 RepID=UPI003CCCB570
MLSPGYGAPFHEPAHERRPVRRFSRTRLPAGRPRVRLHSVTVRYENAPDRCTIYPRDTPAEERVTVWLTADLSAFVGLEARR